MAKSIIVISGLFTIFILTGCQKNDNNMSSSVIEYVKYGTSFGECIEDCMKNITVKNSEIAYSKSGLDSDGVETVDSNTENLDNKYWVRLIDKINFETFLTLDATIGCPDCDDSGAEWIEIKSKGKTHKVTFEYGNEPEVMKEYIGYLRTYLSTFQISSEEAVDFNARTIINQQGFIKNFVATRGSYQWLIGIKSNNDTTYYFDKHLDDEYHIDNLNIQFNGVLGCDSTMIYKPAPNDVPIPDFKIRNITTFDIGIIED